MTGAAAERSAAADETPAVGIDPAFAPGDLLDSVCSIWRETLQRNAIGPDDDFFALGGHSLLLLKVIEDLEERTGVDIPVRFFLDHPTPRALAGYLATHC
jgi:acyl carrier protein